MRWIAMGENRPYRVRGSATDARLMRVKGIAILSLALAFIAINWVTTQHAATVLRDAPWLGPPLFQLPVIGTLYAPWAWITWWIRWHAAPALAPLWTLCAREALYPMAVITAVAAGVIAFTRNGSLANASDLHGSARWANTRDLTEARLIDSRGPRLRRIAASLRLVRPRAHRACVYLGVWRRSLIRDRSHTHVLVVGPTQSGKGRGIVIPTLLTWPHSVIVNDVKDENWALTARALQPALRGAAAHAARDPRRLQHRADGSRSVWRGAAGSLGARRRRGFDRVHPSPALRGARPDAQRRRSTAVGSGADHRRNAGATPVRQARSIRLTRLAKDE